MGETKNEVKKLSYEELENVAKTLSDQCNQLYAELQKSNMTNVFKRLDYLFKVVDNYPMFNKEFADACITEIEEIITIKEEPKED